jgi:hypothetical protein
MDKTLSIIILATLALLPTARAQDYEFTWSYDSSLYTGSGTLTIDPTAPGNGDDGIDAYVPVTFTGTFAGQTILSLDTSPWDGYQNFFYFQSGTGSYVLTSPNQTLWEIEGLAINTATNQYIMYGYPAGTPTDNFETYDAIGGSGGSGDDGVPTMSGTFVATPTPEPTSVALLSLGLLAMTCGRCLRRRPAN